MQVRVVDADDDTNWSCSGGFTLVAADDVVVDDEDADRQPGMTVMSPRDGDLAYAGNTYTVMVSTMLLILQRHSSFFARFRW